MTDPGLKFIPALHGENRLVRDYLDGRPEACAFFGGSCTDSERIKRLAAAIDKRLDRARLVSILKAQDTFTLTGQGHDRLERFEREGGFVVTTGQQSMLFGGPLFILYKALTAFSLSRRFEELLGAPVLTLFWNASEDHDYAEIASLSLLDRENHLRTLSLPERRGNDRPACMIEVRPEIETVIAELESLLPESASPDRLREALRRAYKSGSSLGRAFSHYLAGLLGSRGVFVLDACSAQLRLHSRELFERELIDSASGAEAVRESSRLLGESGYPLQINPLPGDTNLFLIEDGRREKIRLGDRPGEFRLKRSGREYSSAELLRLLSNHPASFSPGVMMRPLIESGLFGSLCYVAGPGEISYYAQMGGLYKLRGLERPVIRPRLSGFVIERKVGKALDKYGLDPLDLKQGAHLTAGRLVEKQPGMREIAGRIEHLREHAGSVLAELAPLAAGIDPTMRPPVEHAGKAFSTVLRKLEKKIAAAARRRDSIMRRQLEDAAAGLWPDGRPQERVLAGVQFLARYGPEFLDFIAERAPVGLD